MIHDEPTKEIELPWAKPKEMKPQAVARVQMDSNKVATPQVQTWVQEFDEKSPWVFRLLLVTAILLLSMLVL